MKFISAVFLVSPVLFSFILSLLSFLLYFYLMPSLLFLPSSLNFSVLSFFAQPFIKSFFIFFFSLSFILSFFTFLLNYLFFMLSFLFLFSSELFFVMFFISFFLPSAVYYIFHSSFSYLPSPILSYVLTFVPSFFLVSPADSLENSKPHWRHFITREVENVSDKHSTQIKHSIKCCMNRIIFTDKKKNIMHNSVD